MPHSPTAAPPHRVALHRSARSGVEAVTLVSGRSFPRHAHDRLGIGLLVLGAHRSWSGIGQVEAQAGEVIMVNPGEMHDGAALGDGARGWRMLYLDPGLVAGELAGEGLDPAAILRPVTRDPVLAALFLRACAAVTAPGPDPLALETDLLRVLVRALRRHALSGPGARRNPPSPPVAKALARLDAAPEVPASLAELAELCGVSRFQLLRGFAREVGITPHAYLVQRRVTLVRQLLSAGRSLTDAALAAGFADQSHMTRAFVRQFGVTPGRYRALLA